MSTHAASELHPAVRRFVEEMGNTTRSLGIGRVVGQIYAYLYFSRVPRSLSDLQATLGISKGSASMGVRQIEQWGGLRRVWVRGERRDYYEANDWLGRLIKNALLDTAGKKMLAYGALLQHVEALLSNGEGPADGPFLKARLKHLRRFHARIERLWRSPAVRLLLR